jgi:PAS domain S-box-containing protein
MKDKGKSKEGAELHRRIPELEGLETVRKKVEGELRSSSSYARSLIEASLDPLVTIGADGKLTDVNKATELVTGVSRKRLIGTDFSNYFTKPEKAREGYKKVFSEGSVTDYPLTIRHTSGRTIDVLYNAAVYKDEAGKVLGVFAAARDITALKKAAEEVSAKQTEVIQRQAQEILEISTPVMQVWEGALVAPLIGTLDSPRTQRFMERLLQRIVETNSPVALVDVTGVPTIDTQTAQHLIDTISAVRLLGAQVILTGIRPAIAQTLVHLGVDLSGITTRSSLSGGLLVAMDSLGLEVVTSKRTNGKEA